MSRCLHIVPVNEPYCRKELCEEDFRHRTRCQCGSIARCQDSDPIMLPLLSFQCFVECFMLS